MAPTIISVISGVLQGVCKPTSRSCVVKPKRKPGKLLGSMDSAPQHPTFNGVQSSSPIEASLLL